MTPRRASNGECTVKRSKRLLVATDTRWDGHPVLDEAAENRFG